MKIIKLMAENVKKIRAVEITPDGPIVEITGANSSGKSSVLDSIFWALSGTTDIPSQPIRKGELKAQIKLDLGEIIVTRRFTALGGTSLTVEAQNGSRFPSPQSMLDELMGKLAFDPLAFSRMKPSDQLETLRGVVKIEVDIDALDVEIEALKRNRSTQLLGTKSLEARLAALHPETLPELPDGPIDVLALVQELKTAGETNNANAAERRRRTDVEIATESKRRAADSCLKQAVEKFEVRQNSIKELEKQIARIQEGATADLRDAEQVAANMTKDAAEAEEILVALPSIVADIDTRELQIKIQQAQEVNLEVNRAKSIEELTQELNRGTTKTVEIAGNLTGLLAKRELAITSAVMPLPGLSFGNKEVLFDGLPLSQAGEAEQLRISVAIAMTANPKLRILRIKDGSLLDDKGMELLRTMATDSDYQIWIERVDTTGKVGIVMEDGNAHVAPKE
jgi:hypothetical protein